MAVTGNEVVLLRQLKSFKDWVVNQLAGKAASSHNHPASDITSGTLAVARGGTGITANPSMLVNLASTSADTVFEATPRPGVTGTLPIARGGTGATSAAAARTALGAAANITATTSAAGLMSAADKTKLDDLSTTIPIATTDMVGGFKLLRDQATTNHGGLEMSSDGVLQLSIDLEFLQILSNGQLSIGKEFRRTFNIPVIITGTSSQPLLQTNGRTVRVQDYDTLLVLSDERSDASWSAGTILQITGFPYSYKFIYNTPTEISDMVLEELYVPPSASS